MKIKGLYKYILDKDYRFIYKAAHGLYNNMPDDIYLKKMFKIKMGRELDLEDPQTFNEKLQWLKLYDRKPIYTTMVDKCEAKKYVSSIIGENYIIPTLDVWENVDDINFDNLPCQFVLKTTHDSHGVIICRDKANFNINDAKRILNKALKSNYYLRFREWPYKDVKPRIIAEQYMEDTSTSELRDYKIYTFNGKAKVCMINQDRGHHTRADYFDREYTWLDFTWGYDHADVPPKKPLNYEKMFELAEKLASDIPELRVDFYEVNGRIYFGELTFFDGSGFDHINPVEWDYKLGSWLELPKKEEKE